jgi:two-component system alkaline phosphatase synthesis response regulator PhoP
MPERPRILVVEDDATLRDGLRLALRKQELEVETAADGEAGLRLIHDPAGWDCLVLDLMLPGPSGLEILRSLRERDRTTPVILLTARSDESDKVLGLELGADDYVTKPFSLRELIARVRAQLRRKAETDAGAAPPCAGEPFTLGPARIDLAAFQLERDGSTHTLSPKEAGILALLWRERGKAISRDRILNEVWGQGVYVTHRTIDTHVLHLRQKLEQDPKAPAFVKTVHGVGYRLDTNST